MRVGIIGCGFIAHKHLASFREDQVRLTAIADTIPERMDDLLSRYRSVGSDTPAAYADYRQMLCSPHVDTVLVAVPSGLHGSIVRDALLHDKHVVVEKPMALSLQDARAICQLAEQRGRHVVVCHQKRYIPHLRRVHDVISQGGIGRIVCANLSLMYNRSRDYYSAASWRGTWALDGGMLLNQGIHNIDLLIWMIGKPTHVLGRISRQVRAIETEDTATAIFTQDSGTMASITATVCASPSSSEEQMSIVGTAGAIVLTGKRLEQVVQWDVSGEPLPEESLADPYEELYRDLANSIENGGTPLVNAPEALNTLESVFAVYKSHLVHSTVALPIGEFSTSDMKGVFETHV